MTPTTPLIFTFPMPENLANARGHWSKRHKAKVALWNRCDLFAAGHILPRPPAEPLARASVRVQMVVGNPMDPDNAITRCKPLIDWLVTRGYLAGDRMKHLRWEGVPEQRVSHKNAPEVRFVLTPLPPDLDNPRAVRHDTARPRTPRSRRTQP